MTDVESGDEVSDDEDADDVKDEQESGEEVKDEVKEENESDDELTELESNCSGLTGISGLSDIDEDLMEDETPEGQVDAGLNEEPKKKQKVAI